MLFPSEQESATRWDEVGMTNTRKLVRTVKREFNMDDDRVWMGFLQFLFKGGDSIHGRAGLVHGEPG